MGKLEEIEDKGIVDEDGGAAFQDGFNGDVVVGFGDAKAF